MKKQFDDMLKEKEVTEKRCEHEIQELMSTMEKFHQTNGKLVEDKDKEIENLKREISKHKDLSKTEVQCHIYFDQSMYYCRSRIFVEDFISIFSLAV